MKSILISGVSTGIGYDAVRYFTSKGFRVFGSVRKPEDKLRLEEQFPENFHALLFEVRDRAAIDEAVKETETILAGELLSAIVNNAGIAVVGPIQLLDGDSFERQLTINLFGMRNVTNAFLHLLGATHDRLPGQKPGKIINMSSISGVFNTPMNGSYCVAKHAMESLGEVYRRELSIYGIDVISIQPGPIQSEIWVKSDDEMAPFRDSDYKTMIERTEEMLEHASQNAQPAEVISKLIHKIIESKRPRTAYIVHTNKLLAKVLAHWLPARLVDRILKRKLNQ